MTTAPVCWSVRADWPASLEAVFTTRLGGVSKPPFDSWNLGDHVDDVPARVEFNRGLLRQRLGAKPVFLKQVHGTDVVRLTHQTPDGTVADACWADEPGVACTVMVADCLPLLLGSADGRSVAAVHAGWRGLSGEGGLGVIEALLQQWPYAQTAAQRAGLKAWLGPCIGPSAFEVGVEVRQAFVAHDASAAVCFRPVDGKSGKYWADLPALARLRLAVAGIQHMAGNDGSAQWCTFTQTSQFFSHRRDAVLLGSTGRMAACIWRRV